MNPDASGTSDALTVDDWLGVNSTEQGCEEQVCSRSGADRRQRVLRTALYSLVMGRRRGERRRATEPVVPYVDVHEPVLLFLSLGIVAMSLVDALLTLSLLQLGAEEANPFMALLLEHSVSTFLGVKYAVTAVGVISLVMHKNYRVLRVLDGYTLLGAVFVIYVGLICYELAMLLWPRVVLAFY